MDIVLIGWRLHPVLCNSKPWLFFLGPKTKQTKFFSNWFYKLVINLWEKKKNESLHVGAMTLQKDIVLPNQSLWLNTTEVLAVCNWGELAVAKLIPSIFSKSPVNILVRPSKFLDSWLFTHQNGRGTTYSVCALPDQRKFGNRSVGSTVFPTVLNVCTFCI